MWGKRNTHVLLIGMQIGTAPIENSMDGPSNIKTKLSCDSVIPLLDITQNTNLKECMYPYVHCRLFTTAKI